MNRKIVFAAAVLIAAGIMLFAGNYFDSPTGLLALQDSEAPASDANAANALPCPESEQFFGKCFSEMGPFQQAKVEPVLEKRKELELQGADWKATGGGSRISGGSRGGGGGGGGSGGSGSGRSGGAGDFGPESSSPLDGGAHADNVNALPEINSFYPEGDVELERGESVEFSFIATDADDAELSAEWFVDDVKRAEGASFDFNSGNYAGSSFSVKVAASDGEAFASKEWSVAVTPRPRRPDPASKIHPLLLAPQTARANAAPAAVSGAGGRQRVLVTGVSGENLGKIEDIVKESGGVIEDSFGIGGVVVAELDRSKLIDVAGNEEVLSIWPDFEVRAVLAQSVPQIGAPLLWDSGYRGQGTRVAVLDTGIDASHQMLFGKVALERNFTSSSTTNDIFGHGTHVAGIIAGAKDFNGTYSGVAPSALLYNAKVLDDSGSGSYSGISAGINWAVDPDANPLTDDGADVISMSLGGPQAYDQLNPIYQVIANAINRGVVVVISSGNCGDSQSSDCQGYSGVTTPGNSPDAITVGAVDKNSNYAPYSSYQDIPGVGTKPDVVAPGTAIVSSWPANRYAAASGTSMAAPHVSGAAALLFSINPSLSPTQVKKLLALNAADLGAAGKDVKFGSGLINLQDIAAPAPVLSEENISGSIEESETFRKTVKITNFGAQNAQILGASSTQGTVFSISRGLIGPAEEADVNISINGAAIGVGAYHGEIDINTNAGQKKILVTLVSAATSNPVIRSVNVPQVVFRGQVSDIVVEATDNSAVSTVVFSTTDPLGTKSSVPMVLSGDGKWRILNYQFPVEVGKAGAYLLDVTATDDAGNATAYSADFMLVNVIEYFPQEFVVNEPHAMKFTYKNTAQLSTDATASIGIYNESGDFMGQLSETLDMQSNETADFNLSWVPDKTGGYNLKIRFSEGQAAIWQNDLNVVVLVPDALAITGFAAAKAPVEKGALQDFNVSVENTSQSDVNAVMEVDIVYGNNVIDVILLDDLRVPAGSTSGFSLGKSLVLPAGQYTAVAKLHYGNRVEGSSTLAFSSVTPASGSVESAQVPELHVDGNHLLGVAFRNSGAVPVNVGVEGYILDGNAILGFIDFNSAVVGPGSLRTFSALHEFRGITGAKTLKVIALYEGNTAEHDENIFIIDDKAPLITGVEFESGIPKDSPFNVAVNLKEDSSIDSATLDVRGHQIPMGRRLDLGDELVFGGHFIETGEAGEYNFTIRVCDEYSNCASTDMNTFTVSASCDGESILVISEENHISDGLGGGFCVSRWKKSLNGTPSADYMQRFDAVIWGEGSRVAGLTGGESASLEEYVAGGGKLLLEGEEIASAGFDENFMLNVAHATLSQDLSFYALGGQGVDETVSIDVTKMHHVTRNLAQLDLNTSLSTYPDSLEPANGGVSVADWNDSTAAIVVFRDVQTGAKTLFLPFNLNALSQKEILLSNAMGWLLADVPDDVSIAGVQTPDFIRPQDDANVHVSVEGLLAVTTRIYVDGSLAYASPASVGDIDVPLRFSSGKHLIGAVANGDFSLPEAEYLNNEFWKEIMVASEEADLVAAGFDYAPNNPLLGQEVQLDVNVLNIGGSDSTADVEFYVDSNLVASVPVNVPYNGQVIASATWFSVPGRHSLAVVAKAQDDSNRQNDSLEAEIFVCTGPSVLVIADNDANGFITDSPDDSGMFTDILKGKGYCVAQWSERDDGWPTGGYLSMFRAVVWSAGDYWNGTLGANDVAVLSGYGGNILFEGSDLGFDSGAQAFEVLANASFERDIALDANTSALVIGSGPIVQGISEIDLNANLSPFPDSLAPLGGTVVASWRNAGAAITSYGTSGVRKAVIGFSIDSIIDRNAAERLVSNAVAWLTRVNSAPSIADIASQRAVVGQKLEFEVAAIDPDGDPLEYYDDSPLFDINRETGRISFTPAQQQVGLYSVKITASDGNLSAFRRFGLAVAPIMVPLQLRIPDSVITTRDTLVALSTESLLEKGGPAGIAIPKGTVCQVGNNVPMQAQDFGNEVPGIPDVNHWYVYCVKPSGADWPEAAGWVPETALERARSG